MMMTAYELTNKQRKYFGLDPIERDWDKVILKGDAYRTESVLYFDKDKITKWIISTDNSYIEMQYNELTKDRTVLLPKTDKGKDKKLTASVLEQRQPIGVHLNVSCGDLTIGNYNTQTTFYSNRWDHEEQSERSVPETIEDFIRQSPENHLEEINQFKISKRKNIKYRSGDYFCFKLDRTHFGFGRLLLDVNRIRKKKLIDDSHGLGLIMGPPIIVELFVYKATQKDIAIEILDKQPKLPSDVMMDNLLFYGEFEIIGNREIKDKEFDFPISYGRSIDQRRVVFFQWGLIHKELPLEKFSKYIMGEKQFSQNPYGYYSNGFTPHYDRIDILTTLKNNGIFSFGNSQNYKAEWDLRNPRNQEIRNELFKVFGLDANKTYYENSILTGASLPSEILKRLQ